MIADELLALSRGAEVAAKRWNIVELTAKSAVMFIAALALKVESVQWVWAAVTLLLVAAAGLTEVRVRLLIADARVARRAAIRHWTEFEPVDSTVLVSLRARAGSNWQHMASALPSSTCEAYFGVGQGSGADGIRLAYACSAFYTSRLAAMAGVLHVAIAATLLAAAWGLATAPDHRPVTVTMGLVLGGAAGLVAGIIARATALLLHSQRVERLLDVLLRSDLTISQLDIAAFRYDTERVVAPLLATWMYRSVRKDLEKSWAALAKRSF